MYRSAKTVSLLFYSYALKNNYFYNTDLGLDIAYPGCRQGFLAMYFGLNTKHGMQAYLGIGQIRRHIGDANLAGNN